MCPLCGSKRHSIDGTNKNYMILKCTECDLFFSWPMVSNIDYSTEKTHTRPEFNNIEQLVGDILGSKKQRVKILEIGCGDLRHLIKLKLRFKNNVKLAGYDLHLQDYTILKAKQYDIELYTDLKSIRCCFDIVYMFHVLEHVEDPLNFVNKIKSFVCEKGFIVLSVPNPKRITKYIFSEQWDNPGYHLTKWSKKSLMYLAQRSNLQIVKIEYSNFSILDFYILLIDLEEELYKIIRMILKIIKARSNEINFQNKLEIEKAQKRKSKKYIRTIIHSFVIVPLLYIIASLIFPILFLLGQGRGLSLIMVCKK